MAVGAGYDVVGTASEVAVVEDALRVRLAAVVLDLDDLVGGEEPQTGHLEQEGMEQKLLGTWTPRWILLQTLFYKVLLLLVQRLYRLAYQLGRDCVRVPVAAKLQIEHLFGVEFSN